MYKFSEHITFVLFTFNEERRLERAILNFMEFGRILIVDNESTDRTRDIATNYGCSVLINKNQGWVEDEKTVARVKSHVVTDWIYWGFADEMVEASTLSAICDAVHSGKFDIISIVRKNYYYGEFCQDILADRLNRIFRKDSIDFSGNTIHHFGRVMPGSRIAKLPSGHFVHHFISSTAKSYLQAMDRYTEIESREPRPIPSSLRLVASSLKALLANYLFAGGFKTGHPALFLIIQAIYYRYLSAMKLYEHEKGLEPQAIELKNDAVRERILASLAAKAHNESTLRVR